MLYMYHGKYRMRDIISRLNQITLDESVGLTNRKPGTRFANPDGDEIIFHDLTFYPETGSFPDQDSMDTAIDQVAQQIGVDRSALVWMNDPRGALAFGIAHFVDEGNRDYYIGRYFQKISPIRTQNNFPNQLPGGFRLQTKVAQKEAAGYKPTDVLTKLDDLTPDEILNQIRSRFGPDSDEARATETFMAATAYPIVIPQGNMNFTAFTNYFCEILQPMALVLGKQTTGDAGKAESKFMTQGGYDTCKISYGSSKIGGLTDSKLINPAGQIMGLSSKAEAGAKASAKNLLDKVEEMQADPDGQKLLNKYKTEVSLLRTVTEGSTPGPLNTAVIAGIITPKEKNQIMALRDVPARTEVVGTGQLSAKLERMYRERKARNPAEIIPFFHLRATIANQVADWVNENSNFGQAAAEILNWGAFIQVYTYADQRGTDIVLKPFKVVWPSSAVTDVLLSADKTFYSTGSKGNFVFKILYNGASEDAVELDTAAVDTKPDVDLDQYEEPPRSNVKARKEPQGTKTALGRSRR
jgi:hypothetical protein